MQMDQYPDDGRRIGAFYAESVSLVEFLCRYKHKGRGLRRSCAGLLDGFEPALEDAYGIHDFDDLQDWQREAFGGDANAH